MGLKLILNLIFVLVLGWLPGRVNYGFYDCFCYVWFLNWFKSWRCVWFCIEKLDEAPGTLPSVFYIFDEFQFNLEDTKWNRLTWINSLNWIPVPDNALAFVMRDWIRYLVFYLVLCYSVGVVRLSLFGWILISPTPLPTFFSKKK